MLHMTAFLDAILNYLNYPRVSSGFICFVFFFYTTYKVRKNVKLCNSVKKSTFLIVAAILNAIIILQSHNTHERATAPQFDTYVTFTELI